MIRIDTGPLVALLDVADVNHRVCTAIAKRLPSQPFLTTWPCFTEAMHLLGSVGGFPHQAALWRFYSTKHLVFHEFTVREIDRMAGLMRQYRDTPMDLADASLIVTAESRSIRRIFRVDSDFYIYRLLDGSVLEVIR